MAVDITQQAYQAISELVQKIMGNRDEAAAYAEDPHGYLAAEGFGYDLSGCDVQQAILQGAGSSGLPATTWQAVQQSYVADQPPYDPGSGQSPAEYLVQHINQVANVTYRDDDYITQQLTNVENYDITSIDNSVNLDGNFAGPVQLDVDNANAVGDGAVAAGDDINAPVNTGENTGILAETVDTGGGDLKFAQGDLVDQEGASQSAAGTNVGGDIISAPNASVDGQGGALTIGSGNAAGSYTEVNQEENIDVDVNQEEFTEVYAEQGAVVNTEQGDGDLQQQVDLAAPSPYGSDEETEDMSASM